MKKLYALLILLVLSQTINAQDFSFQKGDNLINVGIGFPNRMKYILKDLSYTITSVSGSPVYGLSFEHLISDKFSLGAVLSTCKASTTEALSYYNWSTGYTTNSYSITKYNALIIGIVGNYHFDISEKLNGYAGADIYYYRLKAKDSYDNSANVAGVSYYLHAGIRYSLSKSISAYTELGWGLSILNLGLTAKF